MKTYLLFILAMILISCGSSNQFAKRKYTKGVYVEKRVRTIASKGKSNQKETTYEILSEEEKETNIRKFCIDSDPENVEKNDFKTKKEQNKSDNIDESINLIKENPEKQKEGSHKISKEIANVSLGLGILSSLLLIFAYIPGAIIAYVISFEALVFIIAGIALAIAILGIIISAIQLGKTKGKSDQHKGKVIAGLVLTALVILIALNLIVVFI